MSQPDRRTEFAVSADRTRIAFERVGAGPVVVLVDGALCYRDFGPSRPLAAALSDRYTVVSYDRRGRGQSADHRRYSPQREFEDLHAVIDAVGDEAFVFGQATGAALAFRAAAAGVPIRKVAGYECPWLGQRPDRRGRTRDYAADLQELIDAGRRREAVEYFLVTMSREPRFVPYLFRMMRKLSRQLQALAHTLPYDAQVMGASYAPPVEELGKITVPALAMARAKSTAEIRAAQRAIAEAIPHGKHRELAVPARRVTPAQLRPALIQFFAQR